MPYYLATRLPAEGIVQFPGTSSFRETLNQQPWKERVQLLMQWAEEVGELDRLRELSQPIARKFLIGYLTESKEFKEAHHMVHEMKTTLDSARKGLKKKNLLAGTVEAAETLAKEPFLCAVGAQDPQIAANRDIFWFQSTLAARKRMLKKKQVMEKQGEDPVKRIVERFKKLNADQQGPTRAESEHRPQVPIAQDIVQRAKDRVSVLRAKIESQRRAKA